MRGTTSSIASQEAQKVELHYSPEKLLDKILMGLSSTGVDINKIELDHLTPIEEFHTRGRDATKELLELLTPKQSDLLLDVGCGIGGTSRYTAANYKCKIKAVDLSSEFIYTAQELTKFVKLDDYIEFYKGDATDIPFENEHFDIVVSQHINMNIKEKNRFIKEVRRVLKKGGKFGIHEIFKVVDNPVKYPVPWADDEQISFLTTWEDFEGMLKSAGYKEDTKKDLTEEAKIWFSGMMEKTRTEGFPILSPQALMGDTALEKFNNVYKAYDENKIKVMMAVYTKQ